MIVIACALAIGLDVAKVAISVVLANDWKYLPHQMDTDTFQTSSVSGVVMTVILVMFPVLTMILALAPSTRRWCRPAMTREWIQR
jgi:hypothetical protein